MAAAPILEELAEEYGPEAEVLLEEAGAEIAAEAQVLAQEAEAAAAKAAEVAQKAADATAAATAALLVTINNVFNRQPQTPPSATMKCPLGKPIAPVKPDITPKPVPRDPSIPSEVGRERKAQDRENKYRKKCPELWDSIQKKTNARRKQEGAGQSGLRYRYWDNVCSEHDPAETKGEKLWDDHQEQFESDQRGLERDRLEFEDNCEGELPPGARDFAKMKYPQKSEWRGNSPECVQYRAERKARYEKFKNDPNAADD